MFIFDENNREIIVFGEGEGVGEGGEEKEEGIVFFHSVLLVRKG